MIIKNREELLSHGNTRGRKIALDMIDMTMAAIDASKLTRNLMKIEGNSLEVSSVSYDLVEIENIYVLGAGKAVLQIAEALDTILGDRIKRGLIVEKKLIDMPVALERIGKLQRIKVLEASHPVPDDAAVEGAKEILEIARSAGSNDLVFFCVQGGCTCLTTLPADNLCLKDVKETTEILLDSGLEIRTVNLVRSAITELSLGRLAEYIHPARIVNLVVRDAVWDFGMDERRIGYNLGWGPTVPVADSRDFEPGNVVSALSRYGLFERIPESVRNHLNRPQPGLKVPTHSDFERMGLRYQTVILADPEDSVEAAKKAAKVIGIEPMVLSSSIEGEASEIGIVLGSIAKEISKNERPLRPPCAVISSGETTVKIAAGNGEGGPNQEIVLSAALKLDGSKDITIVSVGTDGTDGPTNIAGGIIDGYTVGRAKEKQIDLFENLRGHNASYVLRTLGDAIFFNEPGNNLCDLTLIIVND